MYVRTNCRERLFTVPGKHACARAHARAFSPARLSSEIRLRAKCTGRTIVTFTSRDVRMGECAPEESEMRGTRVSPTTCARARALARLRMARVTSIRAG